MPAWGENGQAQYKQKLENKAAALRHKVNSLEVKLSPRQEQRRPDAPQRAAQDNPPQARPPVKVRLEQIKARQGAQAKQPDRARHAPSRPKQK